MSPNTTFAKILRFVGIVLMGLTGGFTLLGGLGTSCAAFAPTRFGPMASLKPYQWLYILFVLTGIALGILGIRATILLVKGDRNAYRHTLYTLAAGVIIGIIHIIVSRELRGKSMPVDAVVYTTLLTLILFLLYRIPAIWQGVDYTKGNAQSNRSAGGVTAIVIGILTLTIQYTMGSTHTWYGINYANAFQFSMAVIGSASILLGIGLITWKHKPKRVDSYSHSRI